MPQRSSRPDSSSDFPPVPRVWRTRSPVDRLVRAAGGVAVYLAGFAVLLLVELHFFIEPAIRASHGSDPLGKQKLQAVAWLMFSILLFYLIAGLMLVFRVGRFFFPRQDLAGQRVRTQQMDIWAEAGKRLKVNPEDEAPETGHSPQPDGTPPSGT